MFFHCTTFEEQQRMVNRITSCRKIYFNTKFHLLSLVTLVSLSTRTADILNSSNFLYVKQSLFDRMLVTVTDFDILCCISDMDAAGNAITKASITIADNENLR